MFPVQTIKMEGMMTLIRPFDRLETRIRIQDIGYRVLNHNQLLSVELHLILLLSPCSPAPLLPSRLGFDTLFAVRRAISYKP